MKLTAFIFALLLCPHAFSQEKPLAFKVTTGLGNNSNPLSLTEADEKSSLFYSIKPEVNFELEIDSGFWLFGAAAINFKDYNEDIISNGGKNFSQIYEVGISKSFNQSHEVGLALGYTDNNSRQLDFNGASINSAGRALKSNSLSGVISYAYLGQWGSVILNLSQLNNEASTLTNDEFGIEYEDTFSQQDISLKFSFDLAEKTSFDLTPYYSRRDYDDRPARNTEGITQGINPKLEELHRGIEASITHENKSGYEMSADTIFIREKDLIFGAEDADVLGLSLSGKAPIYSTGKMQLALKASLSFSTKEYNNFIKEPKNIAIQELREEDTTGFGLGFSLELNADTNLEINYSSTDVDSNYAVAGSSFKNDIIDLQAVFKF